MSKDNRTSNKATSKKKVSKKRKPVAYLHTMHYEPGCGKNKLLSFSKSNPFGRRGVDYSKEYEVTTEGLYRE